MPDSVIIISAETEWKTLLEHLGTVRCEPTPFGDCFEWTLRVGGRPRPVVFVHGGWAKIAAAASTQYAIDRWKPRLIVNIGTCGGFEGRIAAGQIALATRTVVYDIIEQMTDPDGAIAAFTTEMDLSWLPEHDPHPVVRTPLVSADRDLLPEQVPELARRYGAVAGDWESGAIAWVSARNDVRCLILRGVSDVVTAAGSEAYGNFDTYLRSTRAIVQSLYEQLPGWLACDSP